MKLVISMVIVALVAGGFTLKAASATKAVVQKNIDRIEAAEAAALR
jgi:hypothetical protein